MVTQFERALTAGSISILEQRLKQVLLEAYSFLMKANAVIPDAGRGFPSDNVRKAATLLTEAEPLIQEALNQLLTFLRREQP